MNASGSLVCVGVGITLESHLTPLARSYIEQADVVFANVPNQAMELWLAQLNKQLRSLQSFYQVPRPQTDTSREIVEAILEEVRSGKKVCAAYYGHPGVFSWQPHEAIRIARKEGFIARMEPGISAEDCLYADLGIDPGKYGCQHYDARQIMLYRHSIDTSAYLVLWQAGLAKNDRGCVHKAKGPAYRQILLEVLTCEYPLAHEIFIYTAPRDPVQKPQAARIVLELLPHYEIEPEATIVIPPATDLLPNVGIREKLSALDAASVP